MSNKPIFDGEKLALLRARAGTTQRDLADNIGTTASMISRYEVGACQPRLKVVVRLEDEFCVERGGLYIKAMPSQGTGAAMQKLISERASLRRALTAIREESNDLGACERAADALIDSATQSTDNEIVSRHEGGQT